MSRDLFAPGDRLGEYEIEGRLRAGGMATLFFGRRHSAAGVSREVVIKVIHPHLADNDLIVRMFIDEARISSQIRHSNVVYVETFGEHEGVFYIVMEHVDGCSLEQLLRTLSRRREQLEPEVACHIAMEIAAGLHAAHETVGDDGTPLGIVHRDISPSNVLITRDGRVKVIDFGIAKARNRLGETRAGDGLKGKLRYMSPEQAFGRELDRRADVYALGIVLWELLTVQPLFRHAEELGLLELVRAPTVPAPSTLNPSVGLALDAVIARALAPALEARTASTLELRRELMRAVPGAMAIPGETIGQLVNLAHDTLGSITLDTQNRRPSTPPRSATVEATVTATIAEPSGRHVDAPAELSSVRAGQLHPPAPRRALAVRARGVVAAGVATGVILLANPSRSAAVLPAPTRIESTVHAPPAAPVPAEPRPAAQVPVQEVTRPATGRRPKIARPRPPAHDVKAVEVDGITLADEPTAAAKPRPRAKQPPKPTARPVAREVDGTVLAE
ncbi:MAG: protein kinase [Kofleriaceae bacterium]